MIDIKFIINGREVSQHNVKDVLMKRVMESVEKQVQQKVGHAWCPAHGQRPRIIASGSSLERLNFSVEGCCQKVIDEVRKALK